MIGVWALLVYLGLIIIRVTVLKRNIGEAMILGFLAVLPFLGGEFLTAGWAALWDALTDEIVYATMMFVFMGFLLERVGVMIKMIDLLNSLLGRFKGGPAYVSTVGSAALGSVVHNQAAIAAHRDAQGRPIDHAAAEPIGFELFSEVIEANRIEVGRGDIVLVRTGWAEWFLGLDVDARRAHAQTKLSTGLRQQVEYPQWAWDHQIALLASDCFAVERLPVVEDSPFLESAPDDKGMMHQEFLAHLGIPLGEMWRFDQLAGALAAAGRHSCLITVKPLNLVGGTGSPANAVAIL